MKLVINELGTVAAKANCYPQFWDIIKRGQLTNQRPTWSCAPFSSPHRMADRVSSLYLHRFWTPTQYITLINL